MTDNEIIKALNCCNDCDCAECPLIDKQCNPIGDALDLINRQKEEIDSLNEQERILIYHLAFEREKAIKEFAERLKEKPIKCGIPLLGLDTKDEIEEYFNGIMMQVGEAIDNLVKEMVGDN